MTNRQKVEEKTEKKFHKWGRKDRRNRINMVYYK